MKTPFSFKLGNRGLLPQEESVVQVVNEALAASARKHGLTLNATSKFAVKNVPSAGIKTVRRATSAVDTAVEHWPIAAG